MKDTFLSARLVEKNLIRLSIFSSIPYEDFETKLIIDHNESLTLKPTRRVSTTGSIIVDYRLSSPLELGHHYDLSMPSRATIILDVSEATTFPGFEDEFYYDGDDLGATYTPKETRFAIWAPLASEVLILYRKPGEEWSGRPLARSDKGVYRTTLLGDLDGYEYKYIITNSGNSKPSLDPYGKASTPNGECSVVFNPKRLDDIEDCRYLLPKVNNPVIYEANVRDMTSNPASNISSKGTFKGLYEKDKKTKGGIRTGFDYIKSLNITHLQLLPIFDFKTIDELKPSKKYNWGYDPQQYFVPEGSYSSDVKDPYSRIRECKTMIEEFHKSGIRIVMDVVFNHVYEYQTSSFEAVVPNYYFRKKNDYRMTDFSGCGNDLATEKKMVRKMVIDSIKWWVNFYHIDGLRFDLMGLIDVDTLNEIKDYLRSVDEDFMLYGEGWNMAHGVKTPLGTMENHDKLEGYSFFNDAFREEVKRYSISDFYHNGGFKYAMMGSCVAHSMIKSKWENAKKSINYVECHDNSTLFDYIEKEIGHFANEDKRLRLQTLVNTVTMIAPGIPFFHAGQEIGISKYGKDNTYNLGDEYNRFPYELLEEREAMVDHFASLAKWKQNNALFKDFTSSEIQDKVVFEEFDHCIVMRIKEPVTEIEYKELVVFVNVTPDKLTYVFPEPYHLVVGTGGAVEKANIKAERIGIPEYSCLIFGLRK